MRIKLIAILTLLVLACSLAAQAAPLTAADRVQNLANEEAGWRYFSGGAKLVAGGLVTGAGYSLASYRENLGAIALVPLGVTLMVPGVLTLGWGAADLVFGSREYENQNDKLKLASDADREPQAAAYLKDKADKDRQGRQPSFWNAFGLFSLFETPAEREYNAYQKDQTVK